MCLYHLFPPAAVMWKSCITIPSLDTVLQSPSPYKEGMYWKLPQNSIFYIGFQLWFLFMILSVLGLAFFFGSSHPSHLQNLLQGTCQLHTHLDSPWQLPCKPTPSLFLTPSRAAGFVKDYSQSRDRPLTQFASQEALNFPSSKLGNGPECMRKNTYFTSPLFHLWVVP